jgi:HEAT repeat protein
VAHAFTWPREAARIEAELAADDVQQRRAAARRLDRLTPGQARPLLNVALEDADADVRLAAARAAQRLRIAGVGRRVVGWLHERDARLRLAAVELLALDPVEDAVLPLGRVLADADVRVRRGAAAALGDIGQLELAGGAKGVGGRAAAQLLGRLDDADAEVRVTVVDSLARLGDARAVLPLVSKIQDDEAEVRVAIVRALGVLGDPRAGSALLLAARDREPAVVAQAVRALGFLGDESAVPSLIALSEEPTPIAARRAALSALATLSSVRRDGAAQANDTERASEPVRPGVERLVRALEEPEVQIAAAEALRRVGSAAERPLKGCLAEASGKVAALCGTVLASVAPETAVGELSRALERGSLPAAQAMESLGRTGSERALVVLLEHLTHPEAAVRAAALEALLPLLVHLGGDRRAAGPLLAALELRGWSSAQRADLYTALGRTGDPSAGAALAAGASASESRIRKSAVVGLGRVPDHGVDAVLLAALDDGDAELRRAAALSLRATGSRAATEELLVRLESRDGQDREAVALSLRGPLSQATRPQSVLRAWATIERLPGPARDSVIEALAAAPLRLAQAAWEKVVAEGSPADRSKLAEALGRERGAREVLQRLARDPSADVRAEAIWALGDHAPEQPAIDLVRSALRDSSAAVVTNAVATLGRWAHSGSGSTRLAAEPHTELCSLLEDRRAAVRANAVRWLTRSVEVCGASSGPSLLRSDPAELVRMAIAEELGRQMHAAAGDRATGAGFELRRCAAFERSRRVATTCERALHAAGTPPIGDPLGTEPREGRPLELAFVVPREEVAPRPRVPYVLSVQSGAAPSRAVQWLRAGRSDRRGALLVGVGEDVRLLSPGLLRPDDSRLGLD